MLHNSFSRIYLVGMPASGKTTVGTILANQLSYKFIDTDHLIEKQQVCSIPGIFQQEGEEFFRNLEKEILHHTLPEKAVISTGGGMPCFFDNMEFIKNNGISVFLNVPTEVLAQRAAINVKSRPLLHSDLNLVKSLSDKLQKRIGFYKQADIVVNFSNQDPLVLSKEIMELL